MCHIDNITKLGKLWQEEIMALSDNTRKPIYPGAQNPRHYEAP